MTLAIVHHSEKEEDAQIGEAGCQRCSSPFHGDTRANLPAARLKVKRTAIGPRTVVAPRILCVLSSASIGYVALPSSEEANRSWDFIVRQSGRFAQRIRKHPVRSVGCGWMTNSFDDSHVWCLHLLSPLFALYHLFMFFRRSTL